MKIFFFYLKQHKPLLFLALVLASINQCFSLCDSIITGKLINKFGTSHVEDSSSHFWKTGSTYAEFTTQILFWLALSMGAAMLSRIAKNFQDYFTNIVIQRTSAHMYTDGIKKTLSLPFQDFEDQRSGETLGRLQKLKSDTERFITLFITLIICHK